MLTARKGLPRIKTILQVKLIDIFGINLLHYGLVIQKNRNLLVKALVHVFVVFHNEIYRAGFHFIVQIKNLFYKR